MIVDRIENIHRYAASFSKHQLLAEWIQESDLSSLESGKHSIDGDTEITLIEAVGVGKEASVLEQHRRCIDFQYVVEGYERIGVLHTSETLPQVPYDAGQDVLVYHELVPDNYIDLFAGMIVLFYPGELHAPMSGDARMKKLVCKIPVKV
jgi:YhcH/YjgK/YiaL family protein